MGKIHKAVCISALIHGALFGTVLYIAYHGSIDVPGDGSVGETITVSMITEDGGVNSLGKSMEVKRSTPAKTSAQKITKAATATASSVDDANTASATNKPKGRARSSSGKGDPRLMRMWRKINRSKYYPLNARRNALKGNPRVTFKTGKEGQVEYVRLAKSCGIAQLDDAAIETVKRAVPLPYYPKPITLTIRYSMKD